MRTYFLRILSLVVIALLFSPLRANTVKPFPWDAVLVDVSGDVRALNENNSSISDMIYTAVKRLSAIAPESTIFMPYSSERTMLSPAGINKMSKQQLFDLLLALGGSTSTLNAVASLMNLPQEINRVLLLTNDIENLNGFTPNTLARILSSKGVTVDAAIFSMKADSLRIPHYDLRFKSKPRNGKITELVKLTGGKLSEIPLGNNVEKSMNRLIAKVAGKNKPKAAKAMDYDSSAVEKCLAQLKLESVEPTAVDTSTVVMFNGHIYHGLNELRRAARDNSGRCGYVGEISERYPVFDSYDEADEDRYFSNFVFAKSANELKEKSDAAKQLKGSSNFCKLTADTPLRLLPMVYYRGEGEEMIICGLEIIYDDYNPEP